MRRIYLMTVLLAVLSLSVHLSLLAQDGWTKLFDGKSLDGWKASENPETFSVEDGMIVVDGPRAHLFYVGDVYDHSFKNFEFKADVKTMPGANSGMYFHTEYQDEGWPNKGYEVQVNNSHTDWRRTASLYGVDDVRGAPADDNEWFTQHIIVQDSLVTIKVDGEIITEYVEPKDVKEDAGSSGRYLDTGTFALQGHDPESKVYYKNIMVKALPD
ncbi:3-keto-disaccharide hydrolase [Tunicatimonas pelagia]|uniref:3-keto-disaccharide hydrolase n=1 Tax=Tunicatimonas pelagia TaxID=931531 RepID=UPI002665D02D|nr:DUF1080 domain-containing protein [Tunicatimonas pelagia]WKN45362.1 DUF1080 domain-containing protein [Tunicatimonas pelagia]